MNENGEPERPRAPAAGEARQLPDEAAAVATAGQGEAAATAALTAGAGARQEEALGFRQAMDELEGILQRIEGEEIDIDQLAQELRRAAQLLDLCRGKIRKAEVEVTQIVQSLEEGGEGDDRERS